MRAFRVDDHSSVAGEFGPTLDLRVLATIDDPNDAAFLAELVDLFLADCPSRLAALRDAVAHDDREAADLAAHALKSSALNLGAVALAGLLQSLCEEARVGHSTLRRPLAAIEIEYQRASAALCNAVAGRR
jgi:HPt (histidine-containing phosphotransfer) domain-containing protein